MPTPRSVARVCGMQCTPQISHMVHSFPQNGVFVGGFRSKRSTFSYKKFTFSSPAHSDSQFSQIAIVLQRVEIVYDTGRPWSRPRPITPVVDSLKQTLTFGIN